MEENTSKEKTVEEQLKEFDDQINYLNKLAQIEELKARIFKAEVDQLFFKAKQAEMLSNTEKDEKQKQ